MSAQRFPEDFDLVSTGWIRHIPEPALNPYLSIWGLDRNPDGPVAGDLDDLGEEDFHVGDGGLDEPYVPGRESEDDSHWASRWETFVRAAADRGIPMSTPRHAIELMRAIGLVERVEHDGEIYWRPVVPVPLAEDVLPLDAASREQEAKLRWHHRFEREEYAVIGWLVDQQGEEPTTTRTVSLRELAAIIGRDSENLRQGLALANESEDIDVSPDPEKVADDDLLTITVDWPTFAENRVQISFADPDDEAEAA